MSSTFSVLKMWIKLYVTNRKNVNPGSVWTDKALKLCLKVFGSQRLDTQTHSTHLIYGSICLCEGSKVKDRLNHLRDIVSCTFILLTCGGSTYSRRHVAVPQHQAHCCAREERNAGPHVRETMQPVQRHRVAGDQDANGHEGELQGMGQCQEECFDGDRLGYA